MARRPSQVFAGYLREARERKGWSQRDLVAHLEEQFGVRMDPATIARLETEQRGLSLDEAFMLSALLGVAPLHMMVPREAEDVLIHTEDDAEGPTFGARQVRSWVTGELYLRDDDDPLFFIQQAPKGTYDVETNVAYRKLLRLKDTLRLAITYGRLEEVNGQVAPPELLDELEEFAGELEREVDRYVREQRTRREEADGTD